MSLHLADLVEHTIDAVGDRVAVLDERRSLTFDQLEDEANRLAHYLQQSGIGVGDTVGILAANSVEHVVSLIALVKMRAIPINLNYRYTTGELQYVVEDAELVGIIHEARLSNLVESLNRPAVRVTVALPNAIPGSEESASIAYADAIAGQSGERDFAERDPQDLFVMFTGGTTGHPKGVMWRHGDVWRALGGGIDYRTGRWLEEYDQSEKARQGGIVAFPLSPMMHGAGVWSTLMHLFVGDTTVLVGKFDVDVVWKMIQKHRVQGLFLTGDAMARPLIEAYETGEYDGSTLRAVSSSATIFSHPVKSRWMAAFPQAYFGDSFGSTESGVLATGAQTPEGAGGPIGKAGPQTIVFDESLNVLDPEENIGVVGLLGRRGLSPVGYWKDEARSKATFFTRDGENYVIVGDYVRIEEDGMLTLLGRGSGCINTGGEKVFPEEVEGFLKEHPAIWDALVVGTPNERWGQQVSAVVQAREGHTPELAEVQTFLRERIADYKLPRQMVVVDEIPRHATGKANYVRAKELLLTD